MGKHSVSTSFLGGTIATASVIFTGRKKANWPMKPKKPTGRRKIVRKNGRKYSVPKDYQVTVETFRGSPAVIKPSAGKRVFVAKGINAPLIVGKSNKPMIHSSSSVPHAIKNEKSVALWRPKLNEKLNTRFFYHFKRLM